MSVTLTKLRLKMERAEREFKRAQEEMETAQAAYHAQVRLEGLCPVCMQPDPKDEHWGKCYVTVGAADGAATPPAADPNPPQS